MNLDEFNKFVMHFDKFFIVKPKSIQCNFFEMLNCLIGFKVFRNLKFAIILQENPQVHQELIIDLEALKRYEHFLSVVLIDRIKFLLQNTFILSVLYGQNRISLFWR
jgi:hypothetical protein